MICLLTVDHAAIHEDPGAGPRTLAHSLLRKVGDLTLAHTHRSSFPSAPFGTPTRTPLLILQDATGWGLTAGTDIIPRPIGQGGSVTVADHAPPFLSYPPLVPSSTSSNPGPFPSCQVRRPGRRPTLHFL